MTQQSDTHTVVWVPRFWPAVGGTEFHSHELARNLAQTQKVTVLTHCTETESAQAPLAKLAAESAYKISDYGELRVVNLAATQQYKRSLALLGQNGFAGVRRRAYRYCFDKAFRVSATEYVATADRIHFIYNGLTSAASLACDLAHEHDIPFVFTPNVLDTSQSSAWSSKSFRELYASAAQLIALTEHEASWLVQQGARSDRISVVPYGPILQERCSAPISPEVHKLSQSDYVMFLGRLVPEKGYEMLLQSFERLTIDDQTTQLVLVGPAEHGVCQLIAALNARFKSKRIHLLQNVSQAEKTMLLEEALMLCLPSRRESLGGVYIESMACATPVIALDRPVSRCVIDHGQDGLLVDDSVSSLMTAMRKLLEQPELAEEMGRAGRKKIAQRYAWPVVTKSIKDAYALAEKAFSDRFARAS